MWAKFRVDRTLQGSGATPKSAGVAGGRGGTCSRHFWDLLGSFGIFWDLFGSLRGTHDDVCFAMLCFCYHSFVDCFCGRKRPYEMRGSGRARDLQ